MRTGLGADARCSRGIRSQTKISPNGIIANHRGAPARAIQDLAGHQDLATTHRYMHLSPGAIESAIRLLDGPELPLHRGNMVATGFQENANVNR